MIARKILSGTAAALMFIAASAAADTLVTKNYTVGIQVNCPEGDVVCDDVSYHAVSHKSGNELRLKGKTLSRMCADGVTPCQFLGYEFTHGNTTYLVLDSGQLRVTQGDKVLVDETGQWLHR